MAEHKTVFRVLGAMQDAYYKSMSAASASSRFAMTSTFSA